MDKITLYVERDGRLLEVSTVEMPSFKIAPDVIIWGARAFIRRRFDGDSSFKYVEGYAYQVLQH